MTRTLRPGVLASVCAWAVIAAVPGPRAQAPVDRTFEAVAGLVTSKMAEYRVPGVALGVLRDGSTTIRGFAQDGVGPRIFDGVSPSGGNALFILNNEIRFPVAGIFDGVAFVDAGNIYDRLSDFRPWSVRKAGGLGIRIRTPYFLIRFDYGIKLDRRPGEALGQPFFSIGQAF